METTILIRKKDLNEILLESRKYPALKLKTKRSSISFFGSVISLDIIGPAMDQSDFHRYLDILYPMEVK